MNDCIIKSKKNKVISSNELLSPSSIKSINYKYNEKDDFNNEYIDHEIIISPEVVKKDKMLHTLNCEFYDTLKTNSLNINNNINLKPLEIILYNNNFDNLLDSAHLNEFKHKKSNDISLKIEEETHYNSERDLFYIEEEYESSILAQEEDNDFIKIKSKFNKNKLDNLINSCNINNKNSLDNLECNKTNKNMFNNKYLTTNFTNEDTNIKKEYIKDNHSNVIINGYNKLLNFFFGENKKLQTENNKVNKKSNKKINTTNYFDENKETNPKNIKYNNYDINILHERKVKKITDNYFNNKPNINCAYNYEKHKDMIDDVFYKDEISNNCDNISYFK